MLLAKTLGSSTFRLALIAIGIFGLIPNFSRALGKLGVHSDGVWRLTPTTPSSPTCDRRAVVLRSTHSITAVSPNENSVSVTTSDRPRRLAIRKR